MTEEECGCFLFSRSAGLMGMAGVLRFSARPGLQRSGGIKGNMHCSTTRHRHCHEAPMLNPLCDILKKS